MTLANMSESVSLSPKARIKRWLQSFPLFWGAYCRCKQEVRHFVLLRYFFYDMRHTFAAMIWRPNQTHLRALDSELLFQYHKLEKGLVMPGKRRLFGLEPAKETMNLVGRWRAAGHRLGDPVLVGAVETLRAYHRRLREEELDPDGLILPRLEAFLSNCLEQDQALVTPQPLGTPLAVSSSASDSFRSLAEARRSVRDFLPKPVPDKVLLDAVQLAQLAPSACNRQPCRVYLASGDKRKRALLGLQNGNAGFGHLAPHVAVITSDEQCFFDASERHEPYIDGGLFAMSLMFALRSHGVASCCLNWCVPPSKDRAAHTLLDLPDSQRIVMLMAIGYAPDGTDVPRSPRRALADVFIPV